MVKSHLDTGLVGFHQPKPLSRWLFCLSKVHEFSQTRFLFKGKHLAFCSKSVAVLKEDNADTFVSGVSSR
jgi:hypothetical protein